MTSTNRTLNRLFLLLAGLLLLAVGAAAVLLAVVPDGPARWDRVRTAVDDGMARAWSWRGDLDAVGLGSVPWLLLLVPVAVVVLVVLLGVFVGTQGRGRARDVVADRRVPEASVTASYSVDAAVAREVVRQEALRGGAVSSVRVVAYRVGTVRALRLVAGVRRNAPVTRAVDELEAAVAAWDALAVDRLPVVARIVRGTRDVRTARRVSPAAAPVRVETGTVGP